MDIIPWVVLGWIAVALLAAPLIGRIAAAGEHERRMATLKRDAAGHWVGPGTADAASVDSRPSR